MLNIEQLVTERYPSFQTVSFRFLLSPMVGMMRLLFHEREINYFLDANHHLNGFAFIEQVLEHFAFGYTLSNRDRCNIPASGRVVIVANHPLGALDALALIQLVGEIRNDVKVVANEMLWQLEPLRGLLLPVDNLQGSTQKQQIKSIQNALEDEQAVIFFPAGEVSRIRPSGVRDGKWNSGFLRFALRTQSPVLPVYIKARNSSLFYGASAIYKPLAGLLLVQEMFTQRSRTIGIRVGEPISVETLRNIGIALQGKVKMVRRHLYRIGQGKRGVFITERSIAHPQSRQQIKAELNRAFRLGETRDDKVIYLFNYSKDSAVMKEIGRLRELAFRKVGEGSGRHRDLDEYDHHYRHIVLWDNENLEIVGSYRIGEVDDILDRKGIEGLYSQTLFELDKEFRPRLSNALELGRSFVQPRYWGSRALDYLWQGIGAYLRHYPNICRLYGPVSISQHYPKPARDMLVHYYSQHYGSSQITVQARRPYQLDQSAQEECRRFVPGVDAEDEFKAMREYLHEFGLTVPTLYKQYTDVCEPGGVEFLSFNVDPDFSNCIDGLICVDLAKLKAAKRKRYLET